VRPLPDGAPLPIPRLAVPAGKGKGGYFPHPTLSDRMNAKGRRPRVLPDHQDRETTSWGLRASEDPTAGTLCPPDPTKERGGLIPVGMSPPLAGQRKRPTKGSQAPLPPVT
jgi:hypothetical protein